jgi:hypothetical protein
MGNKSYNALEVYNRRVDIMNMLLSGCSRSDLTVWYKVNFPDRGDRSLEKDITWAYRELKKYISKEKEDVINQHLILYDKLIKDCMNDSFNKGTAVKAMVQKEKLLGLHSTPETQVNIQNNTLQVQNNKIELPPLTVEEIKNLLKQNEA